MPRSLHLMKFKGSEDASMSQQQQQSTLTTRLPLLEDTDLNKKSGQWIHRRGCVTQVLTSLHTEVTAK